MVNIKLKYKMKAISILLVGLFFAQVSFAQSSKQVKWVYEAKKIGDKTYAIHMTATINGDYHLYAQDAGGDGPVPTKFTFVKSPLIVIDGKVKEEGKLVKKYETAWSHDVKYYEKTVDFVQVVKLKGGAKTNLAGKVEFMVCNEKQCLPPSEVDIKVNVGG
jgi:thiol:disulfide interchange protein DsbD